MQAISALNGSVALSIMDPTADTASAFTTQLMRNFKFSYTGNRAPMGVYVCTPW